MKAQWQRLAARFEALSLRERALVLIALIGVLGAAWLMLVLDPQRARTAALEQEIAAAERQTAAGATEAAALRARAAADPGAALRAREAQLQAEIARLNGELQARAGDFVAPTDMAQALRDLLAVQGGLRLVRLETLPPEPLREAGGDTAAVPVYRHGLELEFVGDFASTVAFLKAVEELPWRFFWDGLDYRVERHPTARVILRIHTLSGREVWIGV